MARPSNHPVISAEEAKLQLQEFGLRESERLRVWAHLAQGIGASLGLGLFVRRSRRSGKSDAWSAFAQSMLNAAIAFAPVLIETFARRTARRDRSERHHPTP